MKQIFLDLEFNQDKEIIAIGAIKGELIYYKIIRCKVMPDERIINLTGITPNIIKKQGIYLDECKKSLMKFGFWKWSVFSWGQDGDVLGTKNLNLQEVFSNLYKIKNPALTKMCDKFNIPVNVTKLHNPVYDASLVQDLWAKFSFQVSKFQL